MTSAALIHPQFDPIAFSLGPLAVRWYGLMYLVAFAAVLILGRLRLRRAGSAAVLDPKGLDDVLLFGVLGVVIGGRLGYVLFYKPGYYKVDVLDEKDGKLASGFVTISERND